MMMMMMNPGQAAVKCLAKAGSRQLLPFPLEGSRQLAATALDQHLFAAPEVEAQAQAQDTSTGQLRFFKLISGGMEHHVITGDPLQSFDFIAQNYLAVVAPDGPSPSATQGRVVHQWLQRW